MPRTAEFSPIPRQRASMEHFPGIFVLLVALFAIVAIVSLGACAGPKSYSTLDGERTQTDGLANASRVQQDEAGRFNAQNSTQTPGSARQVIGPDGKTRIAGAAPGPTDGFALDSLGMGLDLSNTVRVEDGSFQFEAVGSGEGNQEATIKSFTFALFETSPPATIAALAGFQREWNPAKIAEVQAVKEAHNAAVQAWADVVKETLPALADMILKTFLVP